MSLILTCTIILWIEAGAVCNRPGNLARMSGTFAPGKQSVVVLKKWMFLMMKSTTSRVVGVKRGRGVACRLSELDPTRSVSIVNVEGRRMVDAGDIT